MEAPNECCMSTTLHLRGEGPLNVEFFDMTRSTSDMDKRYSVSIGVGVRMQEVTLFLDSDQVVQLAGALETWARSIQADALPDPMVGAVDPQQDDELVDVRGDK